MIQKFHRLPSVFPYTIWQMAGTLMDASTACLSVYHRCDDPKKWMPYYALYVVNSHNVSNMVSSRLLVLTDWFWLSLCRHSQNDCRLSHMLNIPYALVEQGYFCHGLSSHNTSKSPEWPLCSIPLLIFVWAANDGICCMWYKQLYSWFLPSFLDLYKLVYLSRVIFWFLLPNKSSCISEYSYPQHNTSRNMASV